MLTIWVWAEYEFSSDHSPQVVLVFAGTGVAKIRSMVDIVPIRAMSLFPPQEAVPYSMLLGLILVPPPLHRYLPCRAQPAWMVEIEIP